MKRAERIHHRNNKIKRDFEDFTKDFPHWKVEAVIQKLSKKYFLAPRTIRAIIEGEGVYNGTKYISKAIQEAK